jgi:hypothetical protein
VIGQELKALNLGTGKLRAEELRHKLDPFLKTAQMKLLITLGRCKRYPISIRSEGSMEKVIESRLKLELFLTICMSIAVLYVDRHVDTYRLREARLPR